ncbi:hypothetical protein CLOM_g12434 [Closterium sp. NIES-68]|nr:hypothetical protein CLOM_g12434 [Closterium sp. NIES-68]GJP72500.1 hypothetical protein CLOP_g3229 [Closterium sp. NIES-67]
MLTKPWRGFRHLAVVVTLLLMIICLQAAASEELPPAVSVESFVHAADHDGDGEIGPEEAHQLWARVLEEEKKFEQLEAEASGGGTETVDGEGEASGGEASMADQRLDMAFSYGGSSISTAEMSDHLSHMLTGEKVVAWIVHGLRLPQYADVFRANSIDGLDFPALISDNGTFLKDDLGVKSALHRHKIHTAIFRQVFGLGKAPGAPTNLECEPSGCGAIAVQWDPPANPGVPPVHKYLIQRRVATRVASWKDVGDTSEDAWLDTEGLKPGTEYTYRIQAWGGHGPSEWVVLEHCRALATSADGVTCTTGMHQQQHQQHQQHLQQQQHSAQPLAVEPLVRPRAEGHGHAHGSEIVAVPGAEKEHGSRGAWQKRVESVGGTEYVLSRSAVPGAAAVEAEEARGGAGGQQGSRQGAAKTAERIQEEEEEQEGDGQGHASPPSHHVWSFIWSVNGGILVLGIFSRHSFFFRFVLAAAASAHRLLLRPLSAALPTSLSPASPFLLVRLAARIVLGLRWAAGCVSALLHRVIAALLSLGGDEGGEGTSGDNQQLSPFSNGSRGARRWSDGVGNSGVQGDGGPWGEGEGGDRGGRDVKDFGRNRSYEELSGRWEGEASLGSNARGMPRNGLLSRGGHEGSRQTEERSYRAGEQEGTEAGEGGWGESARIEQEESDDETESLKSVSFKYRCNAEGCRVRFDRWYTLDGLRHRMLKHYCRECQGVYCVRHTRISPHSSRTQCGLDSHCICFSCYARLPAELQLRAERINKLRVGPVAGSGSGSSSGSLGNSFGGSGGGVGGRNGGGKSGDVALNGNGNSFGSSGNGSSGSIRCGNHGNHGSNGDGGRGAGGKISPSTSWMTLLGRRTTDKHGGGLEAGRADRGGGEKALSGYLPTSGSTSGSDDSQGAGGAGGAGGVGTAQAAEGGLSGAAAAAAAAAEEGQAARVVDLSVAACEAADTLASPRPLTQTMSLRGERGRGGGVGGKMALKKTHSAAATVGVSGAGAGRNVRKDRRRADSMHHQQEQEQEQQEQQQQQQQRQAQAFFFVGSAADLMPSSASASSDASTGSSKASSEPDMRARSKRPAASGAADAVKSPQTTCLTRRDPLPMAAVSDPTATCLASAVRPGPGLETMPSCAASVEARPSCSDSATEVEGAAGRPGAAAEATAKAAKAEAAGREADAVRARGGSTESGGIDWGRLERCPSHLTRSRSSRSADEAKRSPSPYSKALSLYNKSPSLGTHLASRAVADGRGGGTRGGSNWFWWYRHGGHGHGHGHGRGNGHGEELKGPLSPGPAFSGIFTSKRKHKEGRGKSALNLERGGAREGGGQGEEGEDERDGASEEGLDRRHTVENGEVTGWRVRENEAGRGRYSALPPALSPARLSPPSKSLSPLSPTLESAAEGDMQGGRAKGRFALPGRKGILSMSWDRSMRLRDKQG